MTTTTLEHEKDFEFEPEHDFAVHLSVKRVSEAKELFKRINAYFSEHATQFPDVMVRIHKLLSTCRMALIEK